MILSDIEIDKLKRFNEDIIMSRAVRKILYSVVDLNELFEDDKNRSNAQIGQIARGYRAGKHLLDLGFKSLEKFKRAEERKPPEENPAI